MEANTTTIALAITSMLIVAIQSQSEQTGRFVFETASIRPSQDPRGIIGMRQSPDGSFVMTNGPTAHLIWRAYPAFQGPDVVGLPAWAASEKYDVIAKAPAGASPTSSQRMEMIRALLADRFRLVVHTELREGRGFNLVLDRTDGRLGPGLEKSSAECALATEAIPSELRPIPVCRYGFTGNRFAGEAPISMLTGVLRGLLDQPVADKTGLTGIYRIAFESSTQPFTGATIAGLPSVFTAVRQQLGLRLESARVPVEVLVIDRLERPSEN